MKEYYMKLLKECFNKFRPMIQAAPSKSGYNKTLGTKIPSQYEVMRQRDNAIKDIVNEAACFGIDVGVQLKEESYESPFKEAEGE